MEALVLPNQQYLFDFSRWPTCGIARLPKSYYGDNVAWAFFQKDSSYLRLFNSYINRMKETGIFRRIDKAPPVEIGREYLAKYEECNDLTGQAIGFENCIAAFLVLGAGIAAAILVIIAEMLYAKVSNKKPKTEGPTEIDPQPNEPTNQPDSEFDIEVVSVEEVELRE